MIKELSGSSSIISKAEPSKFDASSKSLSSVLSVKSSSWSITTPVYDSEFSLFEMLSSLAVLFVT